MIPCICIDDKNRPDSIPVEKWVIEGQKYTVVHVYKMVRQNGMLGVALKECNLDSLFFAGKTPFQCFRMDRFAFNINDVAALAELAKLCQELDGFDVSKLIEEEIVYV